MPSGMTLLQVVIATLTILFGSDAGALLLGEAGRISMPIPEGAAGGQDPAVFTLLSRAGDEQLIDPSPLASGGEWAESSLVAAAQADPDERLDGLLDEPLDGPLDRDDVLDGPVQVVDTTDDFEPLDAPLDIAEVLDEPVPVAEEVLDAPIQVAEEILDAPIQVAEEVLDAPIDDREVLDAPLDDSIAVLPLLEPLDAPVVAETIDLPPAKAPPLVVDPGPKPLAVAPVAKPVAKSVAAPKAVAADPKAASKPVTSVRSKGEPPGGRVEVTAGVSGAPAARGGCDVAVAAGRATAGSDCGAVPAVAALQPAITRSPGSSALISTDNPSLVTSRRDGVQIGEYPAATLGDSIATTVRAAIFPEDVIVPEVLIVPGDLVVAGNDAREDPIVLWRSELDQAAAETGVPVEILATAIRATSRGELYGQSATGGVGLMFVPVEELMARGVHRGDWFDPATNIRVGAEIMAEAGAVSPLPPEAALTNYLALSCGTPTACGLPEATGVADWIVHYRLRMTNDGQDRGAATIATATVAVAPTVAVAEEPVALGQDWPFADDTAAEPVFDPFAGRDQPVSRDDAADRPTIRIGGIDEQDAEDPPHPASRTRLNRD
ncbi:MAG: hypothetical protein M3464_11340 [Chloroflexota bacterium]|nr:hypothetical protein [Chloroflexota bacterium]